jgi:hypothetical protein
VLYKNHNNKPKEEKKKTWHVGQTWHHNSKIYDSLSIELVCPKSLLRYVKYSKTQVRVSRIVDVGEGEVFSDGR